MNRLYILIIATLVCAMFLTPTLFAQEKMKFEEYEQSLKYWQDREAAANAAIVLEEQQIQELKNRYNLTDEEIARIQQEIYQILGVFEADIENYGRELKELENQIKALRALTPEMLYQRQNELEAVKDKLNTMKQQSMSNIPDYKNKLDDYSDKMEGLKVSVPAPRHETYTVKRGDFLWKISAKPEVYNNPYKWPRIWSANADNIKDPNLIYPDQILTIIRDIAKNQHLVVKGETLAKIAALSEILGDPFRWTEMYEANKNQIQDPNVIYPEQILVIPGK